MKKRKKPLGKPSLHQIEAEHLDDTASLLELHAQAVQKQLISGSEAGRLDFFALAERARIRGRNAGGLFRWLLTHQRFQFITQADEDVAAQRLREWRHGRAERASARDEDPAPKPTARALTEDNKLVQACLQVAEKRRLDPFYVARSVRQDWTRDEWEAALTDYEIRAIPSKN